MPVAGEFSLYAHAETGALWTRDGSARVPLAERFYLGGDRSLRSFRQDRVGPKDATSESLGGEFYNLVQLEARLGFMKFYEAALFFDAGNVGRRVEAFGSSALDYAIGAGLIIHMPAGIDMRFDAAFNPDRDPGEEEWVLHLRFGDAKFEPGPFHRAR